ncbi:MAG: MucR family transcriptional regulator [Thermodesulfobacteriota bacterium]
MAKSLLEMATEIVQAQSSTKSMSNEELTASLTTVFRTLQALQAQESGTGGETQPAAAQTPTPEQSIQKGKIICLECGQEFKVLSHKHLASHGLTGDSYREKHGFKKRQPLCAKGLTASRKKAGKERGIPENLKLANAARRKKPEAPAAKKGRAKKVSG